MFIGGALALAVAGGSVATAGAASAHPVPVPKAVGSVALAHPSQYVSFKAQAGHGRYHGWIDYANFRYKAPFAHTNVWNIGGTHQLVFTVGSRTYAHTMQVATVTPVSTTATTFTGTGTYKADPSHYTWNVSGTVNQADVSFTITYTGTADPGYSLTATGVIARRLGVGDRDGQQQADDAVHDAGRLGVPGAQVPGSGDLGLDRPS